MNFSDNNGKPSVPVLALILDLLSINLLEVNRILTSKHQFFSFFCKRTLKECLVCKALSDYWKREIQLN